MLNEKLKHFFATHPAAAVVFVALGVLFTDQAKASGYLGGTEGQTVTTFTREEIEMLDLPASTSPIDNAGDVIEDIPHVVKQGDLDANPELAASGVKVGDTIGLPPNENGPDEVEYRNMIEMQKGLIEERNKMIDEAETETEKDALKKDLAIETDTLEKLQEALVKLIYPESDQAPEYKATSEAENFGNEPS